MSQWLAVGTHQRAFALPKLSPPSGRPILIAPNLSRAVIVRGGRTTMGEDVEEVGEELESLWTSIDFGHIEAVTHDTEETSVEFEVYLIEDASVPALFVDVDSKVRDSAVADAKTVVVHHGLSGNSTELQIAPPYRVKSIKERLEAKLGIPAFLQRILLEETELEEEDALDSLEEPAVHADESPSCFRVTMLRRGPPRITTNEFLTSVFLRVHNWKGTIVERWHQFDTYRQLPSTKCELFEWAEGFENMSHEPFTVEGCLKSFGLWLNTDDKEGHPEAFAQDISRLYSFLEEHCYSPSWIQVYDQPYGHDDNLEMVMFLAGRLKLAPQTLMIGAVHLKCWG